MKTRFSLAAIIIALFTLSLSAKELPKPLRVGTSIGAFRGFKNLNYQNFKEAKEAGLQCIEMGLPDVAMGQNKKPDSEIIAQLKQIKKDADAAGIQIWSVHMPFGKDIDLSFVEEDKRKAVVEFQKRNIEFCKILQPKVILFHPSFYLGLNERPVRMQQLVKSATELNESVKSMGAIMVIENMLGPELLRDANRERPLCRTVSEMKKIMSMLPDDIYAAVDMNHIDEPEKLVKALGSRIKSIHVADGDGQKECHYLPCSGKGDNDWTKVLDNLYKAGYTGPFMFEVSNKEHKTISDLIECYYELYDKYLIDKKYKK